MDTPAWDLRRSKRDASSSGCCQITAPSSHPGSEPAHSFAREGHPSLHCPLVDRQHRGQPSTPVRSAQRLVTEGCSGWVKQGNSCTSQVTTNSPVKMEIADRNTEPRHCRVNIYGKKTLYGIFLFLPLRNVMTFFPQSILQEVSLSKKEKKASTDNSVESSSLPLTSRADCIHNQGFFPFFSDCKLTFSEVSCRINGCAAGKALPQPTISQEV